MYSDETRFYLLGLEKKEGSLYIEKWKGSRVCPTTFNF